MSGADFVFNVAKGYVKRFLEFPGVDDGLVAVLLEATSLEADSTLKDHDTLASILAGSSNEQTTMGRKTISPGQVSTAVDDTNDWFSADITTDITWTAATGNAVGKLLICYDPDTAAGDDSQIVPLTAHSFDVTPDGSDVTAQFSADGFYRAQ